MLTVRARFDGRVFIPEQPVDVPAGTVLEISIALQPTKPSDTAPLVRLAEIADQFPDDPDMPTDAAAQHDHYLYGMPKRP